MEAKSKEREEERFVRETLYERFGVHLRKIPESSCSGEKTADFELIVESQRYGVMEVKTLIRTPRTPENGWTVIYRDNGVREARRKKDNSPQRVGRLIKTSWPQLSLYPEPKILTIVNDESMADADDLTEASNGFLEYGNEDSGYENIASWKIANGHIKEIKLKIDLYIWIDRIHNQPPVFRVVSNEGYRIARLYFDCPDLGTPSLC